MNKILEAGDCDSVYFVDTQEIPCDKPVGHKGCHSAEIRLEWDDEEEDEYEEEDEED